jgi:fermentation-respiration switch protein FrsA (DUF1100 family)
VALKGTFPFRAPMLKLVLELAAILLVIAVAVRLFEPRLAFFPMAGETATPRDFGVEYEATTIATADGERLRVWRLLHPVPLAQVVYFHGNGGNLSIWAPILAAVAQQGFSVSAVDYRGYGLSTGRPNERGLYRDVEAVVEHAATGTDRKIPLVYWGRSLGVVMAAYAATIRAPDGLILESGFADARSVLRGSPLMSAFGVFSSYRFPSAEFLDRAKSPVLVMHGDRDSVIPFGLGRSLFERISSPKTFVTIRGGDHNDAVPPDPGTYWQAVHHFVSELASRL